MIGLRKRNIDEVRKFYEPANEDMRNLALRVRNNENFKRYERKRRALEMTERESASTDD